MAHLVSLPKSAQSVSIGALFPLSERARWSRECEEIQKDLIGWSSFVGALREPPGAIQNWQGIGTSTVCVSQVKIEWLERLHTPVADLEAFNDYKLMVSSATSFEPDEVVDVLEQFDENWWPDALGQAQGRFCIGEEISDEMIVSGMMKHDFIVQIPPIRKYTLRVRVKSIEKATPRVVEPEGI